MEGLPKRKQMRLKGYDYSQNGYYFVTICTDNRQRLFKMSTVGNDLCVVPTDAIQNRIVEKWLEELQNKYAVKIDHYIIMPDHIHFILIIDRDETERHAGRSLQDMVQWFKTMTTNEYIRGVKEGLLKPFNKHLWQKSYYEHIIRNEQDYNETVQYILNNPVVVDLDKCQP